jgi:arginyl-tRNA synthetase
MARRARRKNDDSEDYERLIEDFLACLDEQEREREEKMRVITKSDKRILYYKEENVYHIWSIEELSRNSNYGLAA